MHKKSFAVWLSQGQRWTSDGTRLLAVCWRGCSDSLGEPYHRSKKQNETRPTHLLHADTNASRRRRAGTNLSRDLKYSDCNIGVDLIQLGIARGIRYKYQVFDINTWLTGNDDR